jgi:hypothetical protein
MYNAIYDFKNGVVKNVAAATVSKQLCFKVLHEQHNMLKISSDLLRHATYSHATMLAQLMLHASALLLGLSTMVLT